MPYNPGVVDRSGELLAAGISRGAADLSRGLELMTQEKKRLAANGKMAEMFFRTNPEALRKLGLEKEDIQAMSAKDKSAAMLGLLQGQGFERGQGQIAEGNEDVLAKKYHNAEAITRGAYGLEQLREIELRNAERKRREEALRLFQEKQQGYLQTPELLRREDLDTATRRNLLESMPEPEDMYRYSRGLEALAPKKNGIKVGELIPTQVPGVFINPNTGASVTLPAKKDEKVLAPAEDWVTTDDADEFKAALQKVKDPEVRDAVLKARISYNRATGKNEDFLTQLLSGQVGVSAGKGAEKKEEKPKGLMEQFKEWRKK